MTCAEHTQVEDTKALEEYKAANGTKVCPSCKTLFEKKDGCNHITCFGCQIHICWVCLETFPDSGACYAHLSDVHGGHGLEADAFDLNGDLDAIDVEFQRDFFQEIQMHEMLLNQNQAAMEFRGPRNVGWGPFHQAAADAAALEREIFPALRGLPGGPPDPEPHPWGPFHQMAAMAAEAAALPDHEPVEHERFGGPRGFHGGFRGRLRGRFLGGFGRAFGRPP